MLNFMEDTLKIFVCGLKRWAKINKVTQTALGNVVGRNQTAISDYYRDISRPTPAMVDMWVKHFDLDYEEILNTGRTELGLTEPGALHAGEPAYTPENVVEIDQVVSAHMALVGRFRNKSMALAINERLLELEGIDQIEFARAMTVIDDIVEAAKLKKESRLIDPKKTGTEGN